MEKSVQNSELKKLIKSMWQEMADQKAPSDKLPVARSTEAVVEEE